MGYAGNFPVTDTPVMHGMGLSAMAKPGMKTGLITCLLLLLAPQVWAAQHYLLIISGIGGIEAYNQQFPEAAISLRQSAIKAGLDRQNIILLSAQPTDDTSTNHRVSDKATINQALVEISKKVGVDDRVFLVLIGHGNPRGKSAVFNLPGPDISADELDLALAVLGNTTTVVVNTASASGPFVKALSRENRVVITATSSAREYHATEFGGFFVAAFATPGADRDKDERISILEAFAYAQREVRRSFESDKRLLTEHALLDDNGDGEGSRKPGEYMDDGALANRIYLQQPLSLATGASGELLEMLQRKQEIEKSISKIKTQRNDMLLANYYAQLERLLVDLALLSREIRALGG
jgi:hypothetical protein